MRGEGLMPRCLFVRPAAIGEASGGDEVVYRKTGAYIAQHMDLETLELAPNGRLGQVARILAGTPPELTKYMGRRNAALLASRLAGGAFDVVCFSNEVTFPVSDIPQVRGLRRVLMAHNVQSLVASTDPSAMGRLMRRFAVAFEQKYYANPDVELVLISQADVEGLRAAGIQRPTYLSPPGAPPQSELAPGAGLIPEVVLTGSYGWWRKRRDLKAFALGEALDLPILVTDPLALELLGTQAKDVRIDAVDWSAGLRFGLISDRFQGGFKLKSVEYVARNCAVLSFCDLSREFVGLPHAEEFVRHVTSKADLRVLLGEFLGKSEEGLVERFAVFKKACLERYSWDAGLKAFGEALGVGAT